MIFISSYLGPEGVDVRINGNTARWPDPFYAHSLDDLRDFPEWLQEIIRKDERAELAAQETVLAPEKTLAFSV